MKRVLILGGNGYLGSYFYKKMILDGSLEVQKHTRDDFDLLDSKALKSRLKSFTPDVVINASGNASLDFCESNPKLGVLSNYLTVKALIDAVRLSGVGAKIVQLSSIYVYGDILNSGTVDEEAVCDPVSYYGLTKLLAEQEVIGGSAANLVLRLPFVVGNPHHKKDLFCGHFGTAKPEESTEVFLDDVASRQIVTCDHVLRSILRLISDNGSGTVNLSSRVEMTRFNLGELIISKTRFPITVKKAAIYPDPAKWERVAERPSGVRMGSSRTKELAALVQEMTVESVIDCYKEAMV